jgi:DNA invertase Pin-like site-specific DNA recombinase
MMMSRTRRFVSYLRVSTDKQGRSGLGLEAQRAAVEQHLVSGSWKSLGEFVEVESGKRNERPKLQAALHLAKVTGATLIVAKLDRLSRNLAFIAALQDAKVKFICCDMPEANEFTVHIFAALAQHEQNRTSERTSAALQALKARGATLGNPNGAAPLRRAGKGNSAAVATLKTQANRRAADVLPIVDDIRAAGVTTLPGIAAALNEREILTPRRGCWHPTSVKRLLERV